MMLERFLVVLLQSGVLCAAGLLICAFPKWGPATRSAFWRAIVVGNFALVGAAFWFAPSATPVVPIVLPSYEGLPPTTTVPQAPLVVRHRRVGRLRRPIPAMAATSPKTSSAAPIDLARWVVIGWSLGFALLLGRLGVGVLVLRRLRLSCQPANDAVTRVAGRISHEMGMKTPLIFASEGVHNPFVAGFRKPAVFLPEAWAAQADEASLEAVIRHEISHIRSGDLIWSLVYRVSAMVLWPQPLIWLIGRPMAATSEELSDASVLGSGCPASLYAETLLNLKEHALSGARVPGLGIAAISRGSSLGTRVKRILSGRSFKTRLTWAGRLVILALVAVVGTGSTRLFAAGSRAQRAEMKMAAPGPVKLVVVDQNGKTVTNARVYGVMRSFVPDEVKPTVTGTLVSSNGEVSMDLSNLKKGDTAQLIAEAPGYGMSFVQLFPVGKYPTQLVMSPATRLEGTVKLPDGGPASGITIQPEMLVVVPPDSGTSEPGRMHFPRFAIFPPEFAQQRSVVTDSEGHFAIEGLPQGASVRIQQMDDRFAALGGEPNKLGTGPVTTAPPIKLAPAATIEGRVMRAGKPVAGYTVGAQSIMPGDGGDAVTDANGRYRMTRLQAGSFNIAMNIPEAVEQEVTAAAHERLSVAVGQHLTGIDFDLIPGAVIEGRVTQGGKGVKSWVYIYGPAHPHSGAWVQGIMTDESGHYMTHVPAGEQFVYLSSLNMHPGSQENDQATFTVRDGEVKHLDLTLPSGAPNP